MPHGLRRNAHKLAARPRQVLSLPHASFRVQSVASEHGLPHDRMVTANNDASVGRIANSHLASLPPTEAIRRRTIAHVDYGE